MEDTPQKTEPQSENRAYSKIFCSMFDLKWQNISKLVILVKVARKIENVPQNGKSCSELRVAQKMPNRILLCLMTEELHRHWHLLIIIFVHACAHSLHLQFCTHLPCFLSFPMFCRKLTLLVGSALASRVLPASRAFPSCRVSFECRVYFAGSFCLSWSG